MAEDKKPAAGEALVEDKKAKSQGSEIAIKAQVEKASMLAKEAKEAILGGLTTSDTASEREKKLAKREQKSLETKSLKGKDKDKMEKRKKGLFSFLNFFAKDEHKKKSEKDKEVVTPEQMAEAQKDKKGKGKKDMKAEAKKDSKKVEVKKPKTADEKKAMADEAKRVKQAQKLYEQGLATIKDMISPASMEISVEEINISGLYARSLYIYAYPRYLDTNWLSPVINFDVTMDMSMFIYPINSTDILKSLKTKVGQMRSSMRLLQEKGNVRDPELDAALEDAEELRDTLTRGEQKFFQFALYFTIYAEDKKELEKMCRQIETMLGGKLVLSKRTTLRMEQAFNSTTPYGIDELGVMRNMNTQPLSTCFPFSSSDLSDDKGILYGINRHNNSLVIFDRFSLENANSVVFAKSGAGKSYAVKLEVLRYLMMDTDVIVIDPENEYKPLCDMVGGTYMNVSLTSTQRINPFDLPLPLKDEDVKPGDLLRQNVITMMGLLNLMLGNLNPQEQALIDKALLETYALKGITMDTENPGEITPPTMQDLWDVLSETEGGSTLAVRLEQYTTGVYGGVFNHPTNVDLGTGLVVFSVRDLDDYLRPIAIYVLLNYIWNRVRSSLRRRLMIVDEAWSMMQHEDSARFLFGLVKRARKYWLGVTTITQDVNDFVKSDMGKAIITNSSMQILFKQAPAAIDDLTKVFNLTEGEKYFLLNAEVGEGVFFAGLNHVAIQVIASYGEHQIITTNPEEVAKKQEGMAVTYEEAGAVGEVVEEDTEAAAKEALLEE